MRAIAAAALVVSLLTAVVNAGGVAPPPASRGNPSDLIGTDVDLISHPNLEDDVCPELKALRQSCYTQALAKNSFEFENTCLCSPDVAYALARCASSQYSNITDKSERAAYYEYFLYYAYDCYCVAGQKDVTYNATAAPVEPYVKGWTADAILPPPAGSCPAPGRDSTGKNPTTGMTKTPTPPCNCKPPAPINKPAPCDDGYTRCSGTCIPDPPRCATCTWPNIPDKSDCTKCICPAPYEVRDGRCQEPADPGTCQVCCKGENVILVQGCFGPYCTCAKGTARCGDKCVAACQKGETRQDDCTCKFTCPGNKVPGWGGECICPEGLIDSGNDQCIVDTTWCKPNELWDDYHNACYCPAPYRYDRDGNCEAPTDPTCLAIIPECYPGMPVESTTNETTVVITTDPPAVETTIEPTIITPGATPGAETTGLTTDGPDSPSPTTTDIATPGPTDTVDANPTTTTTESDAGEPGPTDTPAPDTPAPDTPTPDTPAPDTPAPDTPAPAPSDSNPGSGDGPGDDSTPPPSEGEAPGPGPTEGDGGQGEGGPAPGPTEGSGGQGGGEGSSPSPSDGGSSSGGGSSGGEGGSNGGQSPPSDTGSGGGGSSGSDGSSSSGSGGGGGGGEEAPAPEPTPGRKNRRQAPEVRYGRPLYGWV